MDNLNIDGEDFVVGFSELPTHEKQGGAPEGASSPGFFSGMGEIGSHAASSMSAGYNATLAEIYKKRGNEELSKYKEARMNTELAAKAESESKMGMGAQIGSGIVQSAPLMATMLVPGAGIPATAARLGAVGGMSYGQNLGNVLVEQELSGQGRDYETAQSSAGKMAAVDTALGMLPTHAIKGFGARTAAEAGVGATSGVQQTAFTNLATGKDWNEDLAMGGLVGGVTGAGVSAGMSGMNKALGVNWNEAGKSAVNDIKTFGRNTVHTPAKDFQDNYVEYTNLNKHLDDEIKNLPTGSKEFNDALDAKFNLERKGAPEAAAIKASNMLSEGGVKVDLGFHDYELRSLDGSGSRGHMAEMLGSTRQAAADANLASKRARGGLGTRGSARDAGLTYASSMKQLQTDAAPIIGRAAGSMGHNYSYVGDLITKHRDTNQRARTDDSIEPVDTGYIDKLETLEKHINRLNEVYSGYLSSKRVENFEALERNAKDAYRLANELGVINEFMDITGKKGSFDPMEGLLVLDNMYAQVEAKYPSFTMGKPDTIKEMDKPMLRASDAIGMMAFGPYAAVTTGRVVSDPIRAKMSQTKLKKQQEQGSSFIKGVTGKLEQAAIDAKANAEITKAQAGAVKAEGDIAVSQAKVAAAQAKAEAAQAKLEEKAKADAEAEAVTQAKAASAANMGNALSEGGLEGGTEQALRDLSAKFKVEPDPQPSIFGSDVTLAGTTSRPTRATKVDTVLQAQEQAQMDAQAAQQAQQRVEDLRVMARQRQMTEEGTVAPAKADEDSIEVVEAQRQADLAAQQAEASQRQSEMLASRRAGNSDLVQQQNALARADEQKRMQAEEQARQEAEALAAQQPVIEEAPKSRLPAKRVKAKEKKPQAVKDAEENLKEVEDNPDSTWSDITKAEDALESAKSSTIPVKKPKPRVKAETEESIALKKQLKDAEEKLKEAEEKLADTTKVPDSEVTEAKRIADNKEKRAKKESELPLKSPKRVKALKEDAEKAQAKVEELEAKNKEYEEALNRVRGAESILEYAKSKVLPKQKPKPVQAKEEPVTAPEKPVEATTPEVEATAPPKVEKPAQAVPETPRVHSYDLARQVSKKRVEDLKNTPAKDRTEKDSQMLHTLQTRESKLNKAFKKFSGTHGMKHREADIKTVFNEFTDAEVRSGINNADVNAKLAKLYAKQEAESLKMFEDLPPVEVEPKAAVGDVKKTPEQKAKEKVDSEWNAVDSLASKYNFTPDQINEAVAALGTDRSRSVRAETVIKKAAQLSKPKETTPTKAPTTYNKAEATSFLADLKIDLPKEDFDKVLTLQLGAIKGPISEAKVQSTVKALYETADDIKKTAESIAAKDLAQRQNVAKAKLTADARKANADAMKERTDELVRLGEERNKILKDSRAAAAKAKADAAQAKVDADKAAKVAAEKAAADKVEADMTKLADQKQYAIDLLKRKKVNNFKIDMFVKDQLNGITSPKKDTQDMANIALNWLSKQEKDKAAENARIEKKINEVKNEVAEALAAKDPSQVNFNIVVNQVIHGKTNNTKGTAGGMDLLVNKIGTLRAAKEKSAAEGTEVTKLADALLESYEYALKQKQDHPDNPDMWLSKDLYEKLRDAIVGVDSVSSYFGRTGTKVRADIFGSDHSRNFFADWQIKDMEGEIQKNKDKMLDIDEMKVG